MGHLVGAVKRQHPVLAAVDGAWDRSAGVWLHRRPGQPLVDVAASDDMIGAGQDIGLGIGYRESDVVALVREDQLGSVIKGALRVDHRSQLVVVDHDQLSCVDRLLEGLGHHHCDQVADEASPVGGEGRAREVIGHLDEAVVRSDTEIAGSKHGDNARRRPSLHWCRHSR